MAEPTISNRFLLKFNSNIGRVARFSIPRACVDVDAATASAAMDAIIANGAVVTDNGIPSGIYGAKLITTERRTLV
jgi:hypothetical protein